MTSTDDGTRHLQLGPEARGLVEALEPLPSRSAHPTLILLTGLPGSGKSTFAQQLAQQIPLVVVATDWARKQLFTPPSYTATEDAHLHRVIQELIEWLLQGGYSVVRDAVTAREALRRDWVEIATRHNARSVVIELRAAPESIRRRLDERHGPTRAAWDYSDASWEHYLQIAAMYEPVLLPHIAVDTDEDMGEALRHVAADLDE